jgi:ATP-dependent DNA helicase PIF1
MSHFFLKNKSASKKSKTTSSFDLSAVRPKVNFDLSTIQNLKVEEEPAKYNLFNTSKNLFITGKAGTGKSTLLREFVNYCHFKELNVAVVAPTGIASINVGGVTIHSFFQLNIDNPTDLKKLNPVKKTLLESVDVLIVDEISMVSDLHFEQMNKRMNQAKFGQNPHNRQFGGVRIVLFGDLFQLGPVSKQNEEVGYFFESKVFEEMVFNDNIQMQELTKIWRQEDATFINLLSKVRVGKVGESDLGELNQKIIKNNQSQVAKDKQITILCTLNSQVNLYNSEILNTLDSPAHTFNGKIVEEFGNIDSLPPIELTLKKDCQVIFVKNDLEKRWVNGDFGIVKRFGYKVVMTKNKLENSQIYWNYVDQNKQILEEIKNYQNKDYQIKQATYILEIQIVRTGQMVEVSKEVWEKKQYLPIEIANKVDGETVFENAIKEKIVGAYHQFPVKLGYAITVHKSQGMTLNGAIVDFGGGAFGSGLLYVALSRVKSLDNLYLTKPISNQDILLDGKVIQTYQDLQNQAKGILG